MNRFNRKPKMFSRFTSIFHNAVEALAPNLPLQQEFVTHWKAVTHYFIDNKDRRFRTYRTSGITLLDHKVNIDQTNLPSHLGQMVELLVREEEEAESGCTGPCLEYLLHHKVLETLYSLARVDCPPGMKQVVLQFFTKLLSRIKQPILPHINVHRPVQRLAQLCGEVTAGPAEQDEIQFICVVCAKLKADPYLVNFFIQPSKVPQNNSNSTNSTTELQKTEPSSQASSNASGSAESSYQFTVVESLLLLMESNDARVAVKACEGLMLCVSLPESSAITALLTSDLISCLVAKLCTLYSKLPKAMDPTDVEYVQAKWGLDFLSEADDQVHFTGKRSLISFLSWLDYCDQLIEMAHPTIAHALVSSIKDNFFNGLLYPSIIQPSEEAATTTTSYVCQSIHLVSSKLLLNEFVHFILGPPTLESSSESDYKIRDKLFDRCNHLSEELSITTLKLFEILLLKPHHFITESLILQYIGCRTFIDVENLPAVDTSQHSELPFSDIDSDTEQSYISHSESQLDRSLLTSGSTDSKSEVNDKSIENVNLDHNDLSHDKDPADGSDNKETHDVDNAKNLETASVLQSEMKNLETSCSSLPDSEGSQPATIGESSQVGPEVVMIPNDLPSDVSPPLSPAQEMDPDEEITVHKIVNSFLCMLPEKCKSSYQLGDTGYETYLRDAHRQFLDLSAQCESFNWPQDLPRLEETDSEPFHEGPFLKILLDRLTHMLSQSYDINLHITSVLSRIALLPHPVIHEFFSHPLIPVNTGCRTLPKVLEKVAHDIQTKVKPIPDYHRKLIALRKQLMGFSTSYRSHSPKTEAPGLEYANTLTGVIVFEEFCKELAAITFVKYHESAVQL